MLSVGAVYASKKGGKGGGGWVSAWGAVHMAAALAGCRLALAWPFFSFLTQMDVDKAPLPFQGLQFWHCSIHWSEGPDHESILPSLWVGSGM